MKIFLNSFFTPHSFQELQPHTFQKIIDTHKFLQKFAKIKGIDLLMLDGIDSTLKSVVDTDAFHYLGNSVIELARESDLVISIGPLDYMEVPLVLRSRIVNWILLDEPSQVVQNSINKLIYFDASVNIYSWESELLSVLYDILKDY